MLLAWPDCPECQRRLLYVDRLNEWVCRLHGRQFTGKGLALARGFLDGPAPGTPAGLHG